MGRHAVAGSPTFNKHVIKHHFCPTCGCSPFGMGEQKGVLMAAVNVRCLDGVDISALGPKPFDGKSL